MEGAYKPIRIQEKKNKRTAAIKTLKIIDLSRQYFRKMMGLELPEKRAGKFIQITDGNREYIVLSPKGLYQFHANIAERFCEDRGVVGAYRSKKKEYYIIYDPDWQILGGGFWEINDREKRLMLEGSSQAYGKFHTEGLAKRLEETKKLQEYRVIVR